MAMSKLNAFKGRSRGQRARRKTEAIREALIASRDGVMVAGADGKIRFPRLREVTA
jgi:hypothetical protein